MKQKLLLVLFGNLMLLNAQYQFTGQIQDQMESKSVFLSLVENYRKSSRVYADQILSEVKTDEQGRFLFNGDNLSKENRIYRIHIDGCPEDQPDNHFLRNCNNTKSILFIAKKGDTINFPLLQNNQALCEVISTNEHSGILLQIDALKEEMILDFTEQTGEANESLNFQKWFTTFHEFGKKSNEPLAELYAYGFLSDRTNETYSFYLKNISDTNYYTELLLRLADKYPETSFTSQYFKEFEADKILSKETYPKPYNFNWKDWMPIFLILILFCSAIIIFWVKKKRNLYSKELKQLSQREKMIYIAIKNGKTNKEIAAELFISLSTVKTHINNIYKKLNISSREEIKKNQPGV